MMTAIKSETKQSNAGWRRTGEQNWWLRTEGGSFVDLPARIRGDRPFSAELDLAPGVYILGVGRASGGYNDCVRETIAVG